jgi:transcription factor E2F7/8
MQILVRRAKNRYTWIGFEGVPAALKELKVCTLDPPVLLYSLYTNFSTLCTINGLPLLFSRFAQEKALGEMSGLVSPLLEEPSAANVRFTHFPLFAP